MQTESKPQSYPVNFNGHFLSGTAGIVDSSEFAEGWYNDRVQYAVNELTAMGGNWHASMEKCPECGQYLNLAKDGDHYEVETRVITGHRERPPLGMMPIYEYRRTPCEFPNGVHPFEVTINIPSGKLALFNFLDPANDPVPQRMMDECDINTSVGMMRYTQEYAKHNILYPYCGNTSVSAYKTADGIDFRHSTEFDEEGNEIDHPQQLGDSVSCSVWWFTALDLDVLKGLYNTDNPQEKFDQYSDYVVLDVEPGTYTFTMDYNAKLRYRVLASGKKCA